MLRPMLLALPVVLVASLATADTLLPEGSAPPAVEFRHFPSRLHAFIWRNWPVVEARRLAEVLGTSTENVRSVAESLGLPPQGPILPQWHDRGYITVLRRNWHLLPYDQMLTLLGMSADDLAYSLREDDFLFIKLGSLKPKCQPLRWSPPDDAARRRAEAIRRIVRETFGPDPQPEEPRFAFVSRLAKAAATFLRRASPAGARVTSIPISRCTAIRCCTPNWIPIPTDSWRSFLPWASTASGCTRCSARWPPARRFPSSAKDTSDAWPTCKTWSAGPSVMGSTFTST